jgi:hypothetical protein
MSRNSPPRNPREGSNPRRPIALVEVKAKPVPVAPIAAEDLLGDAPVREGTEHGNE